VEAKEEKDLSKSKLYEHLGDLDLQKTLAFNKPKEKTHEKKPVKGKEDKNDVAKNTVRKEEKKNASPTETKPVDKNTQLVVINTTSTAVNNQPDQTAKKDVVVANTNSVEKKPESNTVKTGPKTPDNKTTSAAPNNQPNQTDKKDVFVTNTNPVEKKPETNNVKIDSNVPDNKTSSVAINNQTDPNEKKNVVTTNSTPVDKKPEVPVAKQEAKLSDNKPVVAVNNQPDQNEKKNVTTTNTNSVSKTSNQDEKKDVAMVDKKLTENNANGEYEFQDLRRKRQLKPAASLVDGRVSVPSETIYFKNDSLSIALYDNGEVDGDSVSVIINDELFIEKQGLKSTAFRKTFYVPQNESDSLLVVLYADNLGKYPPNTGLLQIKDGEEIFYVRFKADLDRNAAIVLRRKSK